MLNKPETERNAAYFSLCMGAKKKKKKEPENNNKKQKKIACVHLCVQSCVMPNFVLNFCQIPK